MPVIGMHMPGRPRLLTVLVMLVFLLCLPSPALAACTTTSGTVDLGTATSFTAASTAQNAGGSTGFTCTGSILSLVSTNTVTATIASASNSLGNQPRLRDPVSGDYISYSICKDANCGATYAIGSQIVWSSSTYAGILGQFNGSGGTLPLYIRTVPGAQMASGTYTGTINLNWSWHLCAIGLFGVCVFDDGTASSTVTITFVVSKDCSIAAPSLDFGSAAFVGSLDPVTQTISIRCSKDATYTVGIDDGIHYSSNRRLVSGANSIAYEIYFPANSASRWGHVGAERRSSAEATANAGLHTGTTDQLYTYRAQVLSGQPTPPPGIYTDTLTVDVQF